MIFKQLGDAMARKILDRCIDRDRYSPLPADVSGEHQRCYDLRRDETATRPPWRLAPMYCGARQSPARALLGNWIEKPVRGECHAESVISLCQVDTCDSSGGPGGNDLRKLFAAGCRRIEHRHRRRMDSVSIFEPRDTLLREVMAPVDATRVSKRSVMRRCCFGSTPIPGSSQKGEINGRAIFRSAIEHGDRVPAIMA